jgi:hypothetical protein
MPISFAERLDLQCPQCGTIFPTETWLIVDAQERPDLRSRILDGSLHQTICSTCGQRGEVPAPLLFHDGKAQRVLFAVPSEMPEDEWRAVGQSLLWTLIGALPEARRDPYLGELQAEAGLEGIAAVMRAEGIAESEEEAEPGLPPIVSAIQGVLAANGSVELQHALQRHPILLDPQAVAIFRELAHEAFKQGEEEAGEGFSRAADILNQFREANPDFVLRAPAAAGVAKPGGPPDEDPLDEIAFALLRSHTGDALAATIDTYPELLEPAMDDALAGWAERARAAGKPRIADGIDERRRVLGELRRQYQAEQPVLDAVQALLEAETSEAVEAVMVEYDALFTDAADAILSHLVESADPDLRAMIVERQALLRRVRAALDAQDDATSHGATN